MNTQIMEGMIGANTSIRLSDIPMRVYRQASAEGDTEKMKQALSYTGDCLDNVSRYQEKLEQGMKAEAKAEREKAKLEQEAAIEKRREERRKTEDGAEADPLPETDTVEISEAAKAALENNPAETGAKINGKPLIYTEAGKTAAPVKDESVASFSA